MAKRDQGKIVVEVPILTELEYLAGLWSGIPHYQCKYCTYDVLANEKAILEHLLTVHSSEKAMQALLEMERKEAEAPAAESEAYPIVIEEVDDGTNNPD